MSDRMPLESIPLGQVFGALDGHLSDSERVFAGYARAMSAMSREVRRAGESLDSYSRNHHRHASMTPEQRKATRARNKAARKARRSNR